MCSLPGKSELEGNRTWQAPVLKMKGNISKQQELPFGSFVRTVAADAPHCHRLRQIGNMFPEAILATQPRQGFRPWRLDAVLQVGAFLKETVGEKE
jgi:hypothetical protein